jgi:hypothetical protein
MLVNHFTPHPKYVVALPASQQLATGEVKLKVEVVPDKRHRLKLRFSPF